MTPMWHFSSALNLNLESKFESSHSAKYEHSCQSISYGTRPFSIPRLVVGQVTTIMMMNQEGTNRKIDGGNC